MKIFKLIMMVAILITMASCESGDSSDADVSEGNTIITMINSDGNIDVGGDNTYYINQYAEEAMYDATNNVEGIEYYEDEIDL